MGHDKSTQSTDDNRSADLSPGKLLIWGRERAGLTQEQVAKELYMTLAKVRALENDEYGRLHSNTFARGYLRAYANLVKLDVERVLLAYDQQAQRLGLVQEYVAPKADAINLPMWRFIVLTAAGLTVLWLISMWFLGNREEPVYPMMAPVTEQLAAPVVSSSSVSSFAATSEEASSLALVANETRLVTETEGAMNSSASSSLAADSASNMQEQLARAESSARPITKSSGLDQIRFLFSGECWLELSDANGDVLATDLQTAGTELIVEGKAPFDIKLGNAPVTEIYLNGKKVPIVPAIGTDVLTLKVAE